MKVVALFLVFLCLLADNTPVEQAREQFPEIESLEQVEYFIDLLKEDISAEAIGYTAAMVFMKSRFVKSPFTKLKFFNQGKEILDSNIEKNPLNVEIRYIRYLMQKQIPAFLGYKNNLEEDFNIITTNIVGSSLAVDFKKEILNNMLLVEKLSEEEKLKINIILNQL